MRHETFLIGFNDKDTKEQVYDSWEVEEMIRETTLSFFEGATISRCLGVYRHKDGTLFEENSCKVEVLGNEDNAKSEQFIEEIKFLLNQESVLYIDVRGEVQFK